MKLSNHCFAITGLYFFPPWTVNAGFVTGTKKTLVIDSGSNIISAQTIFGYSTLLNPENELILINTEKHLDHIGGNSYFFEHGIDIYGHSSINRHQEEFNEIVKQENENISDSTRCNLLEGLIAFNQTKIVNPNIKIEENMNINLGEIDVEIRLTPGHTESNISVFIASEKIIYCGDCVLNKFIPNTDEANIDHWLISLDEIEKCEPQILVPGHGNVIIGKGEINNEINRIRGYLNNLML